MPKHGLRWISYYWFVLHFSYSTKCITGGYFLSLFLITLGILIFIRVKRPDDTWYNGRAVAESKVLAMDDESRNENCQNEIVSRDFIGDLKAILDHKSLLC